MATPSDEPQPAQTAPTAPQVNGSVDHELDVARLHALPSEQQDLYLLSFVSDLQRYVQQLSTEALPVQQANIKKEVIKIAGLSAPVPSRVIRNTLGSILADVFDRGSRSMLYETINDLLGILNQGKSDKELAAKHAAVVCLGEVFRSAGDSAISLSSITVLTLLKLLKTSHTGLRGRVFVAISGLIKCVKTSVDEHVARDIWKQARNAASSDKSNFVQKCACLCLRDLVCETSYFNNSSDFDSLKVAIWKAADSSVPSVRHAAAHAMAEALRQTYSDASSGDIPLIRKPKKSKKAGADLEEEAEAERPGSPNPSIPKTNVQLSMGLNDILRVLSHQYCRPATSNRSRSCISLGYKYLLRSLPRKVLEESYASIAVHMYNDLLNHPTIYFNRYRMLLTRKLVRYILADVTPLLTENAQITAARFLINDVLKNYPQVITERKEPSKRVLTGALATLTDLIQGLGPAASIFQDSCREALFQVVQHPSHTVQSHVAQCLKVFVLGCPSQLVRSLEVALSQLQKELNPGETKQPHRKAIGYALIIGAITSAARHKPLYGSTQIYSNVFTFATDLLKSSAAAELRISAIQVQVAWTLIGGLMNLGPSFVKVHQNQLMLLWRNALPPPLTHENATKRGHLELSFLSHVRECALSSLLMFLASCSSLITTDGSKRISLMLHATIQFLDSLPATREADDLSHRLVPALQLQDFAIMLRRRVLQSFIALVGLKHLDQSDIVSQSDLIGLTMRTFTDPERPLQKNLETSLTNIASNFEGLWSTGDNWSFGTSSLAETFDTYLPLENRLQDGDAKLNERDASLPDIILRLPSLPAIEHDPLLLLRQDKVLSQAELDPPATSCINLAIKLFALSLPLQSPRIQESTVEQLVTTVSQPLQREPGRKAAMQVNSALALLCGLSVANHETQFTAGKLNVGAFGGVVVELLRKFLCTSDHILRKVAAQAVGRLCNLAGTQFTNKEVKILIETIVANRDPSARAGCALALGYIHSEVGAMAASLHIKSIVGVLLSLCSDSHSTVHFWALKALVQVAESAGLAFSTFATSTLGLLAQLYSNDTHNEESASQATSNLEMELFTPFALSQCVDSIINVLGPDLQDVSKARNLILVIITYLQKEGAVELRHESYQCLRHLCLYAPAHVQFSKYVQDLQANLSSDEELMQSTAIKGLGELMKRNASEVARVASSKLSDDLWSRLDDEPNHQAVQGILQNWMQQTILVETAEWIERCQTILSKTRAKAPARAATVTAKSAMPDLADEEVAGFATAVQGETAELAPESQEYLRWQTRDFAMQLLAESMQIIQAAISSDQVIHAEEVLQSKVADVIRLAFSASTANVVELRIWGLRIIDQILKLFGKTPDPDFLEASLLEQYQAQISSALTPAFAADSSPELAAEAIGVCATFVATGIVTNADRMGRIFKVLAIGVDNLNQPEPEASIGDLKGLSPNAQAMLKMGILSGWAHLQLASTEQPYLDEILQPYIPKLAPLWLTSLQEFAGLRFEPEISDTLGGEVAGGNLDERYASFNREVRLKFYQRNWLSIVDAIAVLVERDSGSVFDALDNKRVATAEQTSGENASPGRDMSFREEPVAFFFILFGLAFEALVTQAREDPSQALAILQALRKILTPAVSGNAIYEDAVFNETTDTLDRLALTSTRETQSVLVEIARNLSLDHLTAKSQDRDDKLSDDIEQLFELTRIIILVLTGLIPTLEDPPGSAVRRLGDDGLALVELSFQAIVEVAEVFPAIIRADLHACIIHIYCTMLATGICQEEVLPRIMPIFKKFLEDVRRPDSSGIVSRLIRGCLHRMLMTLTFAQRRENEYSITCAKNTLLSMTILLTTASSFIPPNDTLVARAVAELLDCIQDVGLAKIAAGCIRKLLASQLKSPSEELIARTLWQRLIPFINDPEAEDPESIKASVAQSLVASVATLKGSGKFAAMSILVPTILSRASDVPAGANVDEVRKEGAARLLELIAADQLAFKVTVGLLDEEQRSELETLLRAAGIGQRQKVDSQEDSEARPAIQLRMDFD
ncbi:hypothetical protein PV10_06107 [Exophiala mesophila]|uniref:LAA1-like C-terminal TPR repeats domain-containing protein n=1 Tax=Exophiala mesophila TaxID=212818 RepID=A0A0D1ZA93_EXOME|nr:uncharacterized protein PV10_06107 [Exophiala mesophila]KIV91587.1 hypothetical protein PV10_06107 [Exophiala mesophila]